MAVSTHTIDFQQVGMQNLPQVGGKNASLGEMISHLAQAGVSVPAGFATTADSYREFIAQDGLEKKIHEMLTNLDVDNIAQLTETGKKIRELLMRASFAPAFEQAVYHAYDELVRKIGHNNFTVAVRSSATAEDLPDASFAGQQETLLNVRGIDAILEAIKEIFASLYNDRAIAYRVHHGFSHSDVALSAGIQQMVRSDLAVSGVMFTIDTESGFDQVVFITSSYGLGEMIVQGAVNPDEFYVHKPCLKAKKPAIIRRHLGSKALKMVYCHDSQLNRRVKTEDVAAKERLQFSLTNDEIELLAKQALIIEEHYGRPMDIEWAKDGQDGKLYILQARPETVKSRKKLQGLERYNLQQQGEILTNRRMHQFIYLI